MGNVFIITIAKCVFVYFIALFLSRMVGTKIISKMNFLDLVMGVSMGSMIANAVIDKDSPIISEITALVSFSILTIVASYITLKSFKIRRFLYSEPIVLIKDGTILDKNMKKLRVTIGELMMKLREKSVFNLSDIDFAIMESDGKISVLLKGDKKPLTPYDMNITVQSGGFLKDLIIDGNLIERNLDIAGINKKWLLDNLNKSKIKDISEVFYAGIDSNKKLIMSKKGERVSTSKDEDWIE
ncbi:DUF421 domain-containing protein [Clostridium intestinale]|uniref:DUF421 domain-containing protein n=1 Tax=Clostridium intestinale TaxID=36845 RepID=UPI002DD6A9FF|nr:DUF421 domain-containing protein [Clostridium intestinale]WRY53911.1 DUF421 domain-containing protein [Clostridium intestinale]